MKLKNEFNNPTKTVDYILDTKDGMRTKSSVPAQIVEEIVKRADTVEIYKHDGKEEIVVNDESFFPAEIFDFEDGEAISEYKPATKKKSGRPTKAELVEEARETMTNPQLHKAIEEAKHENEEKRANKLHKKA